MAALYWDVDGEGPPPSDGAGYGDLAASIAMSCAHGTAGRWIERRVGRSAVGGRSWVIIVIYTSCTGGGVVRDGGAWRASQGLEGAAGARVLQAAGSGAEQRRGKGRCGQQDAERARGACGGAVLR